MCSVQKYTPTNHSNAVILSTTKCAESQACQMCFHIIPIVFVLSFNTKYHIGCDSGLAGPTFWCGYMLLCMRACSEWLSRVHGRWKRALRVSLWAPGWRGRECGFGSKTLCDNEREGLSPGPDSLPAPSFGLAGSSLLFLIQPQSQLPQHCAPVCVSPRLSSASQPEPAGSSPGTRWTHESPCTTACLCPSGPGWRYW